ncbi:MAG: translation elongation factor 4 [Bacillota bacterium]|nr:translation elongation factor 4 [Bacillota bacterium]NLU54273.1 elongation factor 4 [Bacillota bacterium]HOA90953.1 translation elongation factor 4 [Bacillota bacterium]HOP54512.1 translation elongation factor 4 [Bacillota bacterium]HPT60050.1 translation elongation factor 4 [Bacillota bacterium]
MQAKHQDLIRNFCIIAHIDHGKSTLADRLLEITNTVSEREMKEQLLDSMELERERGITIKAKAIRMNYSAKDGKVYQLNLIDTPGHVDFSYEVSRSLAACEGALLVVDATQGIEAQTLANLYQALDHDLKIIPVINKIDLPSAQVDEVTAEIEEILGETEVYPVSAKTGEGVLEVLEAIVREIPPPKGDPDAPLRALIFDSYFDSYRGAVAIFRVVDGKVKVGDRIMMYSTGKVFEVTELGTMIPTQVPLESLVSGEVGYLTASMKDVKDTSVGDTITLADNPAKEPLPGYRKAKPMVFCGLYPVDNDQFPDLRAALEKLQLNDASLVFEPETSAALGFGFRCGFLGLLHMDIVQERLEREYNLNLIVTAPSVIYHVVTTKGNLLEIDNPSKLPSAQEIDEIHEPMVQATIITPDTYVGPIMQLCQDKRGMFKNMEYLNPTRAMLTYEIPLSEILMDFFDRLKSCSQGYASLDYEITKYQQADLVKLDILINGKPVDALSTIIHREKAAHYGRSLAKKLKEVIPQHLFEVPIQAAIGSKVVARETVRALRKDVLAKCYGGDVSRKRKLIEKQKEGKKRMKAIGNVEIPQEAFMSVLKVDDND